MRQNNVIHKLISLALALALAGCQLAQAQPTATAPPTPTAVPPTATATPPPTATPEPTATSVPPTPTLTPTPAPIVLFSDSFDSDNNGWAGIDSISTREVRDGQLFVGLKSDNRLVTLPVPQQLPADVNVSFNVEVSEAPEGTLVGVLCRMPNPRNYYWFEVGITPTGGGYALYRSIGGNETELIPPTGTQVVNPVGRSNHVRVICSGDQLQLAINGNTVVEHTDSELESGEVALFTMGPAGTQVSFDNLNVALPDGVDPVAALLPESQELAAGEVIYQTGFESLKGWDALAFSFATGNPTDNFTLDTRTDGLYIEVPERDTSVYALLVDDFGQADVRIDLDVETIAGPNRNNISVVCRSNDDGWYEFSMHSGGLWNIYKFSYDRGFEPLGSGASTAIKTQKAANHLTVVCQDDAFTLYVNDVEIHTAHDSEFSEGSVGVSVSSFDIAGAGVLFSQMTVTVPDPDNPPGGAVAPTLPASAAGSSSGGESTGGINGGWFGLTSQVQFMGLYVENDTVTYFEVWYSLPSCPGQSSYGVRLAAPITNGAFSASAGALDVSGRLDTDGSLVGTLTLRPNADPAYPCSEQLDLPWFAFQ